MFWQYANLPAYFNDRWHREDPYDPPKPMDPGRMACYAHYGNTLTGLAFMKRATRGGKMPSYLRFKNVEVGYTVDDKIMRKVGVEGVENIFEHEQPAYVDG